MDNDTKSNEDFILDEYRDRADAALRLFCAREDDGKGLPNPFKGHYSGASCAYATDGRRAICIRDPFGRDLFTAYAESKCGKLVSELPKSSDMAHLTFAEQVKKIASSNPDKADEVRSFLSKMTSGKNGTLTELRNKYKFGMDVRKMVQKTIDRQKSAANNLNKPSTGNNQKIKTETKAKTVGN